MLMFAAFLITAQVGHYVNAARANDYIVASKQVVALIYELQRERGLGVGYNISRGEKFKESLEQQQALTDLALEHYRLHVEPVISAEFLSGLGEYHALIHQHNSSLKTFRQTILNKSSADVFNFYSDYIAGLIGIVGYSNPLRNDARLIHALDIYSILINLQEQAGQERARVNGLINTEQRYENYMGNFMGNISSQNMLLKNLRLMASGSDLLEKLPALEHTAYFPVTTLTELSDTEKVKYLPYYEALKPGDQANYFSTENWWKNSSNRIDRIKRISDDFYLGVYSITENIKSDAARSLIFYLASLFLVMLFSLFLGRLIILRVVGEIGSMANNMRSMQRSRNFDAQLAISGNDEISSMARAFNNLIRERAASAKADRLAATVFNKAAEAIVVTDADNRIEMVNPAFCSITGYSADEVIGENPRILQSGKHSLEFYKNLWASLLKKGSWQGEIWNRRKNGKVYPEWSAISVVRDENNKIINHVAMFVDISKWKKYEKDIWKQANFDLLTGLPNRNMVMDRLKQEIERVKRNEMKFAVFFIDLDHFKNVNDSMGHSAGDELLKQAADRISKSVRHTDIVARLGGDEFITILLDTSEKFVMERIARQILHGISQPYIIQKKSEVFLSGSIGVTVCPDDASSVELLLQNADTAMYKAKEKGRNNVQFFTEEMNRKLVAHIEIEKDLRQALANQEFEVYYQPIINLCTDDIVSVEALIRWNHPDKGFIAPDIFIKVAEETGLIIPIGEWVLKKSLSDILVVNKYRKKPIKVAVNFSSRQFMDKNRLMVSLIQNAIVESGAKAEYLEIEITESILMEDKTKIAEDLWGIRQLGINIHLDDFGTGYSSLSYLKAFPIDLIKIDRSFVMDVVENQDSANLVSAIIAMGKSLHMKTVAEGIETVEQLQVLKNNGCELGQGYLFSKPLPFAALLNYLETKIEYLDILSG
jgi:diguanylate cyclase (GGDEF)-like protein/PAS domain S-box-containing protein